MSELRPLPKTPVFVEEDHHHVLPHIFRCVGAKHLPTVGNAMIHFDSHPDLLIPNNIVASDVKNIYTLYEKLSIENWILPACFLGVIDTIVWVAPPWSNQIPEGQYNFLIGRHNVSNKVLITCLQNYFIAEGIICDPKELTETKEITLYVIKVTENQLPMNNLNFLREVLSNKSVILDIDLDFYSTRNPFLSLYSEINLYQTLKQLYTYDPVPPDISGEERLVLALKTSEQRKELLESFDFITTHLAQGGPLGAYDGPGMEFIQHFRSIQQTIQQNCGKSERIDWKLIHDAGCTCDDTDLPHHVATNEEISILLRQTKVFLQSLQVTPVIVTVSRSSLDEFCPANQVEFIQSQLVELLHSLVGGEDKLDIKNGYQELQQ